MSKFAAHQLKIALAVIALSAPVTACSDSPSAPTIEEQLASLSVIAHLSRPAFRSGDTTTVRIVVTNTGQRMVVTRLLQNCTRKFEILRDDVVVSADAPGICNMVLNPPDSIASGASKVLSFVWRGEDANWAVMLNPGDYELRGKIGFGDSVLLSAPIPMQILP